ncbi:MAG: PD-(D/E)XK nuclease family protein, partial [Janthinobacterium lividum]
AGRLVRGRIDAVYAAADGAAGVGFPVEVPPGTRFLVVDWKTGRADSGDPLQLAIYRLAWAEATGMDLDEVAAVFVHVRDDRVVVPRRLAGRPELERLLAPDRTGGSDAVISGQ